MPLVSVLMPVYNAHSYVEEAVESILSQTFTDFEFIIIDDGSTDESWRLLSDYAEIDNRIILHGNDKNIGLIKTLNKGLSLARGKYIARQDADDVSLPTRLSVQAKYMEQHPEVGLLGSAYYCVDEKGRQNLRQPPPTDTGIRWVALFNNVFCHPSVMLRRDILKGESVWYDEAFPHVEDYELWLRLLKHTRGTNLTIPLVKYRVHECSVCALHDQWQKDRVEALSKREIRNLLSDQNPGEAVIDAIRRCYDVQNMTRFDMKVCKTWIWALFDRFEEKFNVDKKILKQIKCYWIKRLIITSTYENILYLIEPGFIKRNLLNFPEILLIPFCKYLFMRMARNILRRNQPILQ